MRVRASIVLVLTMLPAAQASAQNPPVSFAVEGAGGYAGFLDDAIVGHTVLAASARVYVLPRVSIGPEIAWMKGERYHSDLMLTGNVTVDLLEARPGRRTIPYLLAGGGLFQTRDRFNNDTFTSSEGGFTGGVGVRILITDRAYIAPEFRGGWEPHFRISVSLGFLR
jgi:hypothetical protein